MSAKSLEIDFSFVLASGVHDMKNSISMLLNTLNDVMEKYPPQNQEHAKYYATLEYETARINSELIQVLSLYRLGHDNIRVHVDEHFVMDVLNEQIARNHNLLQSRMVQLTVDCDESLQAYFDIDLMGGVINNVLVNCARYCDHQLHISAQQTADGLCISIDDDGPGYPKEMLEATSHFDSKVSFASGRPHLGIFFSHKVALMHQNNGQQGFIRLSNYKSAGVNHPEEINASANPMLLKGGRFSIYLP